MILLPLIVRLINNRSRTGEQSVLAPSDADPVVSRRSVSLFNETSQPSHPSWPHARRSVHAGVCDLRGGGSATYDTYVAKTGVGRRVRDVWSN